MLDIKRIRDDVSAVEAGLKAKNAAADLKTILSLDERRRDLLQQLEAIRAEQNRANEDISALKRNKEDASAKIAAMKTIAQKASALDPELKDVEARLRDLLLRVPNLPHPDVPVGDASKNKDVRTWGEKPAFDFKPKTHVEIGDKLGILDFPRATKLSGSNFSLFKGAGARLQRALINLMIDVHTKEHGYTEVWPPLLVNRDAMTGTGQLPKMEEDMYALKDDGFFLIPTAEVPVTNIHREEVLREEDLPVCYTAYTPCFRREAGSYGKDTKGLVRVHQFDKVEMVRFTRPETSYEELETLVGHAEVILKKLELPYRVILLASGDLSFAAAKCYDLEIYAAGLDRWLETSSCSNFEDFQARRANIRFKGPNAKKPVYAHTLNGSGVALARLVIAILENYQTRDGDVRVPSVLQPYLGGETFLGAA